MNNKHLPNDWIVIFLLVALILGCKPEDEKIVNDPAIHLSFSKDTVLFDTIFTTVGSITKRLKVYNERSNAVEIRTVGLGDQSSPFSLTVNGVEGKSFDELVLLGKDSMLILVTALINPTSANLPFVVEDSILFETAGNPQQVKLLAWGQNANFLNDSILACNAVWTKERPYVIVNSALVEPSCTLTIESGTRIFFHHNSSLFVGGNLQVLGNPDDKVVFTNDRLDYPYNSSPGQWNGIYFLEGSNNNKIAHAIIKNSVYGIWLGTPDDDNVPDLEISNTIIENISATGLIAFTSDLIAYNLVINNCGEFTLANIAGGNYEYTHLTLANFGFTFFRNAPSVFFSDHLTLSDGSMINESLNVKMANSIIWGNLQEETFFDFQLISSQASFHHNLIRTKTDTFAINNIVNLDPLFISPELFNYTIDSLSPARDAGVVSFVTEDVEGKPRDLKPDLGAYEIKN